MKEDKKILSKEALDVHLNFLKEKDPSIIGKTCQMLSALKIITLPAHEALSFVIGVIDDIRTNGKQLKGLADDQWSDFRLDTLDKYLPKALQDQEWIFSINEYVTGKLLNSMTVNKRRRKRHVPIYIESEDKDGNLDTIQNPLLKDRNTPSNQEQITLLNEIFEQAKLTDREKKIFCFKEVTPITEKDIAELLSLSRDIVKHDYKKASDKVGKAKQAILSKDRIA